MPFLHRISRFNLSLSMLMCEHNLKKHIKWHVEQKNFIWRSSNTLTFKFFARHNHVFHIILSLLEIYKHLQTFCLLFQGKCPSLQSIHFSSLNSHWKKPAIIRAFREENTFHTSLVRSQWASHCPLMWPVHLAVPRNGAYSPRFLTF